MPSQYGEHDLILKHFEGRTGRFLDIGAFDGKTFSNTHCLSELGWEGVCVEPNPPAFCELMRTHAENPRIRVVNAAVIAFAEPRVHRFHANTCDAYSADMMSTLDHEHAAKWKEHPFREIWIPSITADELARAAGDSFEFVNIDVEGHNLSVLYAVTRAIKSEMVCVELDPPNVCREMQGQLEYAMGLKHFQVIGGNLLGWR